MTGRSAGFRKVSGSLGPHTETGAGPSASPSYHVTINPADFSATVTNPWFPLTPGTTFVYTGTITGIPNNSAPSRVSANATPMVASEAPKVSLIGLVS